MKFLLSSALICALGFSSAFAYSAKSDPTVVFKGFKMPKKIGTAGKFSAVTFKSQENADFIAFLKSTEVSIDPSSALTIKAPAKKENILLLFSPFEDKTINAKVVDAKGDDKAGTLNIEITINKVSKTIEAPYTVEDNVVKAQGVIDLLADFSLNEGFAAMEKKCGPFHGKKTWTDVEVGFELPINP